MKKTEQPYIKAFNDVWLDADLTSDAKFLYCKMLALSNKSGICFASQETLAKSYSVSVKTVQRAIAKLLSHSLLERLPEKSKYGTVQYKVLPFTNKSKSPVATGQKVVSPPLSTGQNVHSATGQNVLQIDKKIIDQVQIIDKVNNTHTEFSKNFQKIPEDKINSLDGRQLADLLFNCFAVNFPDRLIHPINDRDCKTAEKIIAVLDLPRRSVMDDEVQEKANLLNSLLASFVESGSIDSDLKPAEFFTVRSFLNFCVRELAKEPQQSVPRPEPGPEPSSDYNVLF